MEKSVIFLVNHHWHQEFHVLVDDGGLELAEQIHVWLIQQPYPD
jgi:hypothetical protein